MVKLGQSFGGDRDIYTALGYPKNPTFDEYYNRYKRQDVARRIIKAPVNAVWREPPDVRQMDGQNANEDTEFEKAWKLLVKTNRVYHYLARADRISGIGQYGVIVLGFSGGLLEQPLSSADGNRLLYMRPYTEEHAIIHRWVEDKNDPRFGLPEFYKINFSINTGSSNSIKSSVGDVSVHHSRIIHLAEELEEDDVFGTPRLENVLNRLIDLERVAGASSEMFWRGGFPGLSFTNREGATLPDKSDTVALDRIETQIKNYVHHLERYMQLNDIDIQELQTQVADPTNHLDVLMSLISASTGIPKRILMGSERGELASSQDKENWADRVDERKNGYAEDSILRPFIDRNIEAGVLPDPGPEGYEVDWPDSHTETEKEQADVNKVKIETAASYSNAQGLDLLIPPSMFLKKYMGFDDDEVSEAESQITSAIDTERQQIRAEREALAKEAAQKQPPVIEEG
jgi:hypothetical protein